MEIQVFRLPTQPAWTDGLMLLDGQWFAHTVEDTVRAPGVKIYGQTAIPAGRYLVTVEMSPRFKMELPRLHGVPNFDGVLIHGGKNADHSSGCILIGSTRIAPGQIEGSLSHALVRKLKAAPGPHHIEIFETRRAA